MFDGITRITDRLRFQPKTRRRVVREVEATHPEPEDREEKNRGEEKNRDEDKGSDQRPVGRRVDLSL